MYESVDGVVLRNAQNQTLRIEEEEIELQRTLSTSLMPEGLLQGLTAFQVADLLEFVRIRGGSRGAERGGGRGAGSARHGRGVTIPPGAPAPRVGRRGTPHSAGASRRSGT